MNDGGPKAGAGGTSGAAGSTGQGGAGGGQESFDSSTDAAETSIMWPRCDAADYTTAPSGAACVPSRFLQLNGLRGVCYGPPIGEGCNLLSLELTPTETPPPNFICGPDDRQVPPRPDIRDCKWIFNGDASHGLIDSATVEAVCAVTVAYPNHVVACINGGS